MPTTPNRKHWIDLSWKWLQQTIIHLLLCKTLDFKGWWLQLNQGMHWKVKNPTVQKCCPHYDLVVDKIREHISCRNARKFISFTTDCWSGKQNHLWASVFISSITEWNHSQAVLNAKTIEGSRTGENIASIFECMLECRNIVKERKKRCCRCQGTVVQIWSWSRG